ncbi:MAG: hypothetical protein ACOCWO_04640, partial [Candidatus Muiribacteriaceae bacterium]
YADKHTVDALSLKAEEKNSLFVSGEKRYMIFDWDSNSRNHITDSLHDLYNLMNDNYIKILDEKELLEYRGILPLDENVIIAE